MECEPLKREAPHLLGVRQDLCQVAWERGAQWPVPTPLSSLLERMLGHSEIDNPHVQFNGHNEDDSSASHTVSGEKIVTTDV